MNDKPPPPTEEIRTDLWSSMTLQQLIQQQDLIISRMTLLRSMMGPGTTPQIMSMLNALEHGNQTITKLINSK